MFILKEAIQKICCCLYMALGNKYIDQLFWKAVESESGCLQDAACCLRKYQADLLNFLSKRIDERELFHLSATLKSFIFFRRNKNNTGLSQPTEKFAVQRSNSDISYDSCSHSYPSGKPAKEFQERYPTISIVTPSYNQGKFLEKCIQSILSQDYPNLELIVIDGGSTDNSIEIIKKYKKHLKYWVSEKDEGQADAINKGLRHATGEIFNWINSDDYLEPGALFKCAEAYEKEPSAVGWVGGCRRIDSNGRVLTVIYPNGMDRENIGQNWSGGQFYQPSCFLSAKRVKEVGRLNPDLYFALDLDFWIRILENGDFFAGRGIWSNAIIHTDAKTQRLRQNMHLETIDLQKKYGFLEGAGIRYKHAFKKGKFEYVPPTFLKNQSKWIGNSLKIDMDILEKPATITLISDAFPRYDRESSRLRLFTILKTLLANKCAINYICTSNAESHKKRVNALKGDIHIYDVSSNHENCERIISQNKTEHVWITTSTDINHIKFTSRIVEKLRAKGDSSRILIDAAPVYNEGHFKNHESDTSQRGFVDENEYLENTKRLFELADKLIVSTPKGKKDIEEKIGTKRHIEIIPNAYEVLITGLPYHRRRNICFIGNLDVRHDIDAARYFVDNIFAFVLRQNPHVEFHVIGNNSQRYRERFRLPNVKMINGGGNLDRLLVNYRLCVFPVPYHTWVNDGFGIASGAGLPIVTSSVGAEGYPVRDGEECFIADLPLEFGEKCNHCLRDSITWHNFRIKSQLMIAENFSPHIVAKKLGKVLST